MIGRYSRGTSSFSRGIGDTSITPAGRTPGEPRRHEGGGVTLRVAVIGSGPAGLYTAEAQVKQSDGPVEVDVLERLATPYGLVRYGVAAQHTSVKSYADLLRRIPEPTRVPFR